MKYTMRASGLFAIVGFALAMQGGPNGELRMPPGPDRELETSAPGVTYVVRLDGGVEFRVPSDFQGVAITPDGRNLYLAN